MNEAHLLPKGGNIQGGAGWSDKDSLIIMEAEALFQFFDLKF